MENQIKKLLSNPLFNDLDHSFFTDLVHNHDYSIVTYRKGSLIAQEGESCHSIGFILEGSLSAKQITPDGKILVIHSFYEDDAIGVAIFGLDSLKHPYSMYADEDCLILYLHYVTVEKLITASPKFSLNYISFLSHRIDEFKDKIQILQFKDVRSRLIHYLLSESKQFKSKAFILRHSKSDISDIIGVARPSLSRELRHMSDEGLISFTGKQIVLLDEELFSV